MPPALLQLADQISGHFRSRGQVILRHQCGLAEPPDALTKGQLHTNVAGVQESLLARGDLSSPDTSECYARRCGMFS
jgi:hypothetical protein